MTTTLADLESWVGDMMARKCCLNYKLDISGNSTKGDGYLGEVTFLKVVANSENGDEKIYHLIVKAAKQSDQFREKTPIREAYEREIFTYTKVFPIYREFQKEHAVEKPFDKFPKCYSVCSKDKKEALVLGNLKVAGFDTHDRKLPQNLNHALFVFRNYGQFHGVSLAMKVKRPGLFKSLTKNMTDLMGKFILQADMMEIFKKDVKFAIDALRKSEKGTLADKFEGFEDGVKDYLSNYTEPNNPQSVIIHGDCWNNNMMFKYENGNKSQPIDIRFIDFQLTRVASPVFDLSYYLYCCADKTVLDHFDFLLQAYHSSLSDALKDLGCDPEDTFTFKDLKEHWKKYGKFGLSMTPFILKLSLCESDEVVDFADSAENGGFNHAFDFKLQQQDVYEQRLVDVFSHFAQKFL